MDYIIKHGVLKGKKVSEAFANGEIKELLELKDFLLGKYISHLNYREKILHAVSTIDYYILRDYSKKIKTLYELYSKLSKEQKQKINLDKNIFENNDLVGLNNLLNEIKQL